jgi:hypothetical protein
MRMKGVDTYGLEVVVELDALLFVALAEVSDSRVDGANLFGDLG